MTELFDTSDTDNRVEKFKSLIKEYGKPFKVKHLRAFYSRKYGEELDANTTSTYVNYLLQHNHIIKLERGLYAPRPEVE